MDKESSELELLLRSSEPCIRYRARAKILGEPAASPEMLALQGEIRSSSRVSTLLSEQSRDGTIPFPPYSKWRGAHWVLVSLADLDYPGGDVRLRPLMDQVYRWLLSPKHISTIREVAGRFRRCASQEGNAVYASLVLGLADDRSQALVDRLLSCQWPDGGWNCDVRPEALNSSYHESLIPLRALSAYAHLSGDRRAALAAERAAEIFLKRELFRRRRDGKVISHEFVTLHYPCYWHYDILFGLKVLAEAGFIGDARCRPALDLLESKRLDGGGFPAERAYYSGSGSRVDWGGTGRKRMNEFVTLDALYVLKSAGRFP